MGFERQRAAKGRDAGGTDTDRAPRQGRRRGRPRKQRFVRLDGPGREDRGRRSRGGRHGALLDDALDDASARDSAFEQDEDEADEYGYGADDFLPELDGGANDEEHESGEGEQEEANDATTIVIAATTDASSSPVQVTSPELETLEEEATEALVDGNVTKAKELEAERSELESEELGEVAKTLPSDAPERPLVDRALELAKAGPEKIDDDEREEGESESANETTAEQPKILPEVSKKLAAQQIPWEELTAEQQLALQHAARQLELNWDPKNHDEPRPTGASSRKKVGQKFRGALASIDAVINDVLKARASVAAAAKEEADAKQREADLVRDKEELLWAAGKAKTTALGREILEEVIGAIKLSSGAMEVIDKRYRESDLMSAHRAWKWMISDTGMIGRYKARVVTSLWNPGWDDKRIYWKQRGPQWERNRNFMARVGKHQVNIHVSPPGKNESKTQPKDLPPLE